MAAGDGGNGQYGGTDLFGMPSAAYANTGAGGSPPVGGLADPAQVSVTIPGTSGATYSNSGGVVLNAQVHDGFTGMGPDQLANTGAGDGHPAMPPGPNSQAVRP